MHWNPQQLAELRATIEREYIQIPRELLHDVCYSVASRYRRCLGQNGHQFWETAVTKRQKDVVKFFYMLKMKQIIIKTWLAVIWSVYTSFGHTHIYIRIYIHPQIKPCEVIWRDDEYNDILHRNRLIMTI